MTWNEGTATDYLDLLGQLEEVLTSRHVATVAVNAGGTGYTAGEVLNVAGGTSTHTAQLEVVTVSSGVITAVRVYRGGAYTVDPTTTANAATTTSLDTEGNAVSGGSSATFDLTMDDTGWTVLAKDQVTTTAAVVAGGSGYTNGDVLTVVGGVLAPGETAATYTATVSAGAVTSLALLAAGQYEVLPGTGAQLSGGTGTGATATVSGTDPGAGVDYSLVFEGDAGANTDPLVGIRSYSDRNDETGVNTVSNWALFGMTTHSTLLNLHLQANVSPGFESDGTITSSTTGDGAFVPLSAVSAGDTMTWAIRATSRAVTIAVQLPSATTDHVAQASFGLFNQFGITTEFPFPAYVAGSSDRAKVWYRDTSAIFGGISEVISRSNGPFFVWDSSVGSWKTARAGTIGTNTTTTPTFTNVGNVSPRVNVWPLGASNVKSGDDQIWAAAGSAGFDNVDLTEASSPMEITPTPDSSGDYFPLYPVIVQQSDTSTSTYKLFGEIDGAFWFHEGGQVVGTGDRHVKTTTPFERYRVFQNGTRVEPYSFLAIKED